VEAKVPVTSLARTIMDMTPRLDDRQLERMLVEADRSGRLSWPELWRTIDDGVGRKGVARLRRVAGQVDPSAADVYSVTETDFLALCREAGIPRPQVNVMVEGRLVDFCWPKSRVIVEADGYAYHRDRPAFERDHQSTVALMAAGYVVLRTTYKMLQRDPTPFLRLVRDSLQRS
jgi:Protein of unknown function (DUF559)